MKTKDTRSQHLNLSESPIFIIGSYRSGTSFLAYALSQHQDICYVGEPMHIWNWGNKNIKDDRLSASDVTDRIEKNIKGQFKKILDKSSGSRLLEKTPTNCLRIPFINKIYPHAKFIFLVRDGRAVIGSTINMRNSPPVSLKRSVWVRMRTTPIYRWPSYLNKLGLFFSRLFNRPPKYWGPRPPGWKKWLKDGDVENMLANQWVSTTNSAIDDLKILGINYFFIKYENLIGNPSDSIQEILKFSELQYSQEVVDYVENHADISRLYCWQEQLSKIVLNKLKPIIKNTNEQFGYKW
jgi:hypothetical protein